MPPEHRFGHMMQTRSDDWIRGAAGVLRRGVALVAVAAACGGSDPVGVRPPCSGQGSLSVTATAEVRPWITWSPDCSVARLVITMPPSIGASPVLWEIRGGAGGIPSGVRYGAAPAGATTVVPATVPADFTNYSVFVYDAAGTFLGLVPLAYVAP